MPFRITVLLLFITALAFGQDKLANQVIIHNIRVIGNKTTREKIILRELTFGQNDTLSATAFQEELKQCEKNLYNTELFVEADINSVPINFDYTEIIITVRERWYLWPYPLLFLADPNFNQWWETKDLNRLSYGLELVKENFRGARESIGCKLQFGYSKAFAFQYARPYIGEKQKWGAQVNLNFLQRYEIIYRTLNNKRQFFRNPDGNVMELLNGNLSVSYRPKIHSTHSFNFSYSSLNVKDSIVALAADYFNDSTSSAQFPELTYGYRLDYRDNIGYPLAGSLTQMYLVKRGVPSASINTTHFYGYHKQYFPLAGRFYGGFSVKGKYNLDGRVPYYTQQGLGYTNHVRGYEYYVIDGQHYALFKSNIKYQLIKQRDVKLNFTNLKQFNKFFYAAYVNLFFDAGYVWDNYYQQDNPLSNSWLPGGGIGIDIATYYDKVFRFELSVNKRKEVGIYLHFTQPI